MIVRVEHNHGDHINLYEGNHIGIHKLLELEKEGAVNSVVAKGLQVIINDPKNTLTLELVADNMTRVFIMNDSGKTIDTHYL